MTAYEYIKDAFKDIEAEMLFLEIPSPGDPPLHPCAEGEPRLRLIITRDNRRYIHEFLQRDYEYLLEVGRIEQPIKQLKKQINKVLSNEEIKPGN